MRGAVPERFNWASCPQGTCPTAPYKIQPPNQICCELWRHVSREVSPFHHTCFRNGGNRASVWWLHSSFCFAQYCNNMLTLTRWHTERVTSSWKHVKVNADRIFGNSLTKRRISKKLKWTKSSLFFQPAANLKYGMRLLLNTFGASILSNKKKRRQHWHIVLGFSYAQVPKQWEEETDRQYKNYIICRVPVEPNQCEGLIPAFSTHVSPSTELHLKYCIAR
jgi:hypothetical protein